jgi:hypothetical protein
MTTPLIGARAKLVCPLLQAYADAPRGRKQSGRDECAPPAIACKPRANCLKPKEIHA